MANILQSLSNLLTRSLEGDPPPPTILQNIAGRLAELGAVSVDPSGDGIERWLSKLREIANNTRLHDTLVVRALQVNFPRLAETLTLLGVIGFEWDGTQPAAFSINWTQFNNLVSQPGSSALSLLLSKVQNLKDLKALQVLGLMVISAPKGLLALEYRQQGFLGLPLGSVPGINSDELLDLIDDLVHSPLRLPLPFVEPLTLEQFKAKASGVADDALGSITIDAPPADPDNPPLNFTQLDDLALELHLKNVALVTPKVLALGGGWKITFASRDTGDLRYRIQFSATQLDTSLPRAGDLGIFLAKRPADANALLIGALDGTHFAIQAVEIGLRQSASGPLFDIVLKLKHIEFALKPDFLKFLSFGMNIPAQLQFDTDVEVSYVQGKGLTGQNSAGGPLALGMQFATPLNLKIGGSGAGLNVDQVVTRLEVSLRDGGGLNYQVLFRYSANAQFGPLSAVMDGAGVWIGRGPQGSGGLLPPQGIGLSLNAAPVEGGGFLRSISPDEFGGALQIKIMGIGAFAYGLYKTLPNGDPSFVALIGIRLPLPGIQISFGFAISGFGGLVGINRRSDTDLLRERLAGGGSGEVLFNDNPMANAPKLLGDMQQFFPDEKGIFLVGPTLQINWLSILKLDVGVFIELPGPRKLFIAGSARLVIGSEEFALVYLRIDFIGGIDFTKSLIFFDAALVNSHVLGIFRITGGVALRIAYGDNGYFLFTVGGFHPSFNPGPMELPRVARVGVSVSLGLVWLKQEMYLAITSNTFQLGSRTEAGIDIGPISAHGWFGFDALIQFKPFYFIARVDAGFDVEVAGVSLCSVHVEGQLSGPGPLVLQAKASVRLLFIKISGSITIELNGNPPENPVLIPDLPKHLEKELSASDNLRIEGEDRSVIFRAQPVNADGSPLKLIAPVGQLIWEQKRAPLNLAIEKVEGIRLNGWHTLVVKSKLGETSPEVEKQEMDWFGVGTYLNLGDSEALNNSRFEQQQSGVRIDAATMAEVAQKDASLEIELVKLPKRFKFAGFFTIAQYASPALSSILHERSGGAQLDPGKPGVSVSQEGWNHHAGNGTVQNAAPLNSVQAFVQTKQNGGIALPATEKAVNLTGVF